MRIAGSATSVRSDAIGSSLSYGNSFGIQRDRMRLLDRTACWTIRHIRSREFKCPAAVVTAAGVKLGGVVSEGEQVSPKKLIEAGPRCFELRVGLFESLLRNQHVGKAPSDLRIAARKRWHEKRLGILCSALA